MKNRPDWSHKGDFGRVLIIGGSKDYVGAPALAGMAAIYAGCDLVTIMAPEKTAWVINSIYPDLITYKLKGDYLDSSHVDNVAQMIEESDSLLIGPGLGSESETLQAVQEIINQDNIPIVLDADALKIRKIPQNSVITPHAGEFRNLFGQELSNEINQRVKAVEKAAKQTKCTLLVKGHVDIISDGQKTFLNRTGNPCMTVGGTGDTLAGILASLLAQGKPGLEAAKKAAEANGRAGEYCLKKENVVLASELIKYIPLSL